MNTRRTLCKPFLFLFFPNMDHHEIHDGHMQYRLSDIIGTPKQSITLMLQNGIGRTMCLVQSFMMHLLSRKSNIIIPRYRRKKTSKTLKINGTRKESDTKIYYGVIAHLSSHVNTYLNVNYTITWFYGSVLVGDKTLHKFRRTEFKQITYTHHTYDRLWL